MITFRKMGDGTWGVNGPIGECKPGAIVSVRKRDGSTSRVKILSATQTKVGYVDCAVQPLDRRTTDSTSAPRPSRTHGGSCRECRGPIVNAPHHRAMDGLCGSCAFDEYDM